MIPPTLLIWQYKVSQIKISTENYIDILPWKADHQRTEPINIPGQE